MVASPRSLPTAIQQIQPPTSGPVCHTEECSPPNIFLQVPNNGSRGHGCSSQPMATHPSLCLSTTRPYSLSGQEDPHRRSRSALGHSILAQTAMVHGLRQPVLLPPVEDTPGQDLFQPGGIGPSRTSVAPAHRLALERDPLRKGKFSG